MSGYKDMTWCPFWEDCQDGLECPRALTVEVSIKAAEWWGGPDYPLEIYVEQPDCFKDLEYEGYPSDMTEEGDK